MDLTPGTQKRSCDLLAASCGPVDAQGDADAAAHHVDRRDGTDIDPHDFDPRPGVESDRAGEVGAAGAGLALLVGFAALYVASKRRRADELTRILRRYNAWIVPVDSPLVGPKVVDVSSMEGLVRLAEHYERAILHEEHKRAHIFALEEDGTLFRYRLGTGELQPLRADQPRPPAEGTPVITRSRGSYRR